MNEPFVLTVIYQRTDCEFEARFSRWGYSHRFAVLIDENTFTFEPDEEVGYRALNDANPINVNIGLLRAVAEKLAELSSS